MLVFTNCSQLLHTRIPWLWTLLRKSSGLHTDALGWNGSTGATAINLALLLGAKRVYLLGFDMKLSVKGTPNWHDKLIDKPSATIYFKFKEGFVHVARDLSSKFPGREVVNVTDDSDLNVFPKISVEAFWMKRKEIVAKERREALHVFHFR